VLRCAWAPSSPAFASSIHIHAMHPRVGGALSCCYSMGEPRGRFYYSHPALHPPTHPMNSRQRLPRMIDFGYDTVACPSSSRDELAVEPS
jgi:hypothetical protein